MKRSEISIEHKWDLSDLYACDSAWEEDFSRVKILAKELQSFKGKLLSDSDTLERAIKAREEVSRILTNVYVYANLRQNENTKDSTYQGMASRSDKLMSEISEMGAFFDPEILEGDLDKVLKLIDTPSLKLYEKSLRDLFRKKPHTLSEEMEAVLAQAGDMGKAPTNVYSMLINADLTFEDVVDSKGDKHPLTNGSYISHMMSSDRELRKDAFNKFYKVYKGHINTISALMQSEVNKNIFFSKMRKHGSAREAALFQNNIPVSVPDQLIEAVNANLPAFHEYMRLRKEILGLDELHLYDIYTPIVANVDFKITYDEAKDMVIESLGVLGKDYQDTIKSAFDQRWIDVYETEGKRGGAFSWGTYDSKPYILLNHREDMDSMFTLTHELGHSLHSYYTRKTQPYVYGNYSIFVAEVASTTNEALLNDYLMKTVTDEDKRKYIINHYLEQFRGTVFRQTMFAEFERDIHAHVEAGGALTTDYLCNHYLEINKKYFGPHVVIDEEIKYEWARIPHMYYNFYVYQYSTGFSAAVALSDQILSEGEPAIERYLEFLASGSKDYPINILRKAGADMETTAPVSNALKVFGRVVEEFGKMF